MPATFFCGTLVQTSSPSQIDEAALQWKRKSFAVDFGTYLVQFACSQEYCDSSHGLCKNTST